MHFNRKVALHAAVAAICLRCSKVQATIYDWAGDGADSNWSTYGNWGLTTFTTPQPGDTVEFYDIGDKSTSNVDSNRSIGTLSIFGADTNNTDYVLTGSNTTLTCTSAFKVGSATCFPTISSGLTISAAEVDVEPTSILHISGGGSVTTPDLNMNFAGTGGDAIVIGNQGTLSLTSQATVTNGTIELDSGGALNISSGGSLGISGNASQLSLDTGWAIPAGATVIAQSSAQIVASSWFDVGDGNTGTLVVDSTSISAAGASASNWSTLGGTATVTLSNSAAATYKSGLRIGNAGGGTAHVTISATSQLNVDYGLYVGGSAASSAATFTSNGTLNIGSHGFALFGAGSTFNFQGGTVQLAGPATFSSGSTLKWSGGTFTGSNQTIAVNGGVASVTLGGIAIIGNTVSVANAGKFTGSTVNIAPSTGQVGTLLVDGAGSKFVTTDVTGNTAWGQAGSATVTISNAGAATLGNQLQLGVGGSAVLNLLSGGSLNAPTVVTTFAGGAATVNLSSGTLNSSGTSQFSAGALVNADGLSGLNFGGNTTFSTGSGMNLGGAFISLASGKTLTIDGGTVSDSRNALIGGGETYIIQNGGHWDATQEDLEGGTLTVTGAGSRFTSNSSTEASEWGGGLNVNFTSSGIGTFAGNVVFGGATFTDQMTISSSGAATFGGLTTGPTSTSGITTGVTTLSISGGTLTTGTALFQNGANVNLSSGQWSLNSATFGSGSSFGWTGGTLKLTGTLYINGATASLVEPQFQNGSTLSIGANGFVQTNSTFDVGTGGPGTSGNIIVDGSNARLISNVTIGSSIFGGGTSSSALLRIADGGAATFTSTISGGINAGNGGAQIFVGNNGGTLTANNLILGSSGAPSTLFELFGGAANILSNATFSANSSALLNAGSMDIGGTLSTNLTASVAIGGGVVLRTHGLSVNDTSIINLASGGIIDDYTGGSPLSTIRGYILSGRNSGTSGMWTGPGINSTTAAASSSLYAVGYADASAIGSPATFMGQSIDNTTLLMRLTYIGDANLDGTVNALDFNALATNYGKTPGTDVWSQGDFNFDGTINSQDFALLAAEYGKTLPSSTSLPDDAMPDRSPWLGVPVPEPISIALIGYVAGFVARRRR